MPFYTHHQLTAPVISYATSQYICSTSEPEQVHCFTAEAQQQYWPQWRLRLYVSLLYSEWTCAADASIHQSWLKMMHNVPSVGRGHDNSASLKVCIVEFNIVHNKSAPRAWIGSCCKVLHTDGSMELLITISPTCLLAGDGDNYHKPQTHSMTTVWMKN